MVQLFSEDCSAY